MSDYPLDRHSFSTSSMLKNSNPYSPTPYHKYHPMDLPNDPAVIAQPQYVVKRSPYPGGIPTPTATPPPTSSTPSFSASSNTSLTPAQTSALLAAGGWHGLDMSRMGLRVLSTRLGIYQHLTTLYLSQNQLTSFPGVLCKKLTHLTLLDLSHNLLTGLPSEIGSLIHLKVLELYNNRISELPPEMGRLFNLQTLTVDMNPISKPAPSVIMQGAEKIIAFLRDRLEPPPLPPDRNWISYIDHEAYKGAHQQVRPRFRVMAYNILADAYATAERYNYCPTWALAWSYRKSKILKEIVDAKPDLVCLQELETGEYQDFFQEAMAKHGFSGIFKPRSRAYTAGVNTHKVDGCAIFYRNSKLALHQDLVVEFQRLALARHSKIVSDDDRSGHERLLTRDNIALIAVFDIIEDKLPVGRSARKPPAAPSRLIVCNTHVHWNPELCDVKLMQTQMMMEELMALRAKLRLDSPSARPIPMIVCGDFNSEPSSGVYELLSCGGVAPDHPEFGHYRYGIYSQQGLKHNIPLVSVYNHAGQGEPPFTNYTATYVGVLDYIYFAKDSLRPCGVLEHVSEQTITSQGYALPSPHFPSDHLPLLAEFELLN